MMKPSNPYFRTFVAEAVWVTALALKMVSRHPGPWSTFPFRNLVALFFSGIITALLLGLAATRFERLRSWVSIGLGSVAGWFVVMGLMMLAMGAFYGRPSVPKFHNTDEMMVYFATETKKWVKADRGVDLDYSFETIKLIEEELSRLAKDIDKANPPKGTLGIAIGYGAYIGEAIRRRDGGAWDADHPTAGPQSYPLHIRSNVVIFPVGWCWKRLTGGEDENVYHKAVLFTEAGNLITNSSGIR